MFYIYFSLFCIICQDFYCFFIEIIKLIKYTISIFIVFY
nr:MAG TPA: hypothetical protein [Caudoviricetes sp.]